MAINMTYNYQEKRIIAVINEDLEPGLALNALGHLAFSAGRYSDQSLMGREEIKDADSNVHKGISKYPFIVLKASTATIKDIVRQAREKHIFYVDYPQEMFDTGPDDELYEHLNKAKEPSISYHAVILVGKTKELKKLTGSLRLYK